MKPFAEKFYKSKKWIHTRDYIMSKYYGVCQVCKEKPAEIVHHKIWLTPDNINNQDITLGEENLIPVCRDCHALLHNDSSTTTKEVMFDSNGQLIKRGYK